MTAEHQENVYKEIHRLILDAPSTVDNEELVYIPATHLADSSLYIPDTLNDIASICNLVAITRTSRTGDLKMHPWFYAVTDIGGIPYAAERGMFEAKGNIGEISTFYLSYLNERLQGKKILGVELTPKVDKELRRYGELRLFRPARTGGDTIIYDTPLVRNIEEIVSAIAKFTLRPDSNFTLVTPQIRAKRFVYNDLSRKLAS